MSRSVQQNFKIRQYVRVSWQLQNQLIELVIIREQKIKQAADTLCIKYPTAKNIINRYRKTKILKKPSEYICRKRCLYKPIEKISNPITLVCTKGGLPFQEKKID